MYTYTFFVYNLIIYNVLIFYTTMLIFNRFILYSLYHSWFFSGLNSGLIQLNRWTLGMYCGMIIYCGGPLFVTFMGNPCTWIYIPTNLCSSICLVFNYKIKLATDKIRSPKNQENFGSPWILTPLNKNDSTLIHTLVSYPVRKPLSTDQCLIPSRSPSEADLMIRI